MEKFKILSESIINEGSYLDRIKTAISDPNNEKGIFGLTADHIFDKVWSKNDRIQSDKEKEKEKEKETPLPTFKDSLKTFKNFKDYLDLLKRKKIIKEYKVNHTDKKININKIVFMYSHESEDFIDSVLGAAIAVSDKTNSIITINYKDILPEPKDNFVTFLRSIGFTGRKNSKEFIRKPKVKPNTLTIKLGH